MLRHSGAARLSRSTHAAFLRKTESGPAGPASPPSDPPPSSFTYPDGLIFGPNTLATSGSSVTAWTGPAGTIGASQTDPTKQAAVGSINGQPAVVFAGASDMDLSADISQPALTLFAVVSFPPGQQAGAILGNAANSGFFGVFSGEEYFYSGGANVFESISEHVGARIFEASVDDSTATILLDGVVIQSGPRINDPDFSQIGSRGSDYLTGTLASPLAFSRVLTDDERSSVRSYLKSIYGTP